MANATTKAVTDCNIFFIVISFFRQSLVFLDAQSIHKV